MFQDEVEGRAGGGHPGSSGGEVGIGGTVAQQVHDAPFIGIVGVGVSIPGIKGMPLYDIGFVGQRHVVGAGCGGVAVGASPQGEDIAVGSLPVGGCGGCPAAATRYVSGGSVFVDARGSGECAALSGGDSDVQLVSAAEALPGGGVGERGVGACGGVCGICVFSCQRAQS